jgi:hypothetical protein
VTNCDQIKALLQKLKLLWLYCLMIHHQKPENTNTSVSNQRRLVSAKDCALALSQHLLRDQILMQNATERRMRYKIVTKPRSRRNDHARDKTFAIMLTIFEKVARKVTERASLVPVAPLSKIDGHVFGSDHLRSKTLLEIQCPRIEYRRKICYHPRVVVSLAVISPPSLTASGSVMEIPAKTNSNPPIKNTLLRDQTQREEWLALNAPRGLFHRNSGSDIDCTRKKSNIDDAHLQRMKIAADSKAS